MAVFAKMLMGMLHISLLLLLLRGAFCLNNGLVLTPPMGWLSWERFRCNIDCSVDPYNCISEKLYMDMADRLVEEGYRDLGYEFVNIDDCWPLKKRNSSGYLTPDPQRFPNGVKYLADYVHERGLKLGIYGDIGEETCGGYPGSYGYYDIDAKTFAAWGIDMVKIDGCYANETVYAEGYPTLGQYLNSTGRSIVYACSWPAYLKTPNYTVIAKTCNLWRNYDDIQDSWDSVFSIINHYAEDENGFAQFAGPGQWNDPDQLIIGDYGLSLNQQRTQMAMWAIYASPLLMSVDLRNIAEESKEILQNQEVIKVNQDRLGKQGRLISSTKTSLDGAPPETTQYIFAKMLSDNSVAVSLLNTYTGGMPTNMTVSFKAAGLMTEKAMVRDLFAHEDLGVFDTSVTVSVDPSGSIRLLLLSPVTTWGHL